MGPWGEAFRDVKQAFLNAREVIWDSTISGAKAAGQWLKAADAWWDRHPTVVLRLVVVILIWSQIMWGWRVDALEKKLQEQTAELNGMWRARAAEKRIQLVLPDDLADRLERAERQR